MRKQKKFYYTNARMAGKTCYLAGPFKDAEQAGRAIDVVGPFFVQLDPIHEAATYGVVEVNRHDGLGMYNVALRAAGVDVEVPN